MDSLIKKGYNVVNSCKNVNQLSVALNYVQLIGKSVQYTEEYGELYGYASGKHFFELDCLADIIDENTLNGFLKKND